MNCADCIAYHRRKEQPEICTACRRMQAESDWKWEIDTGNRILRCPDCGHALTFGLWWYSNPYRYCPWCGKRRVQAEQMEMEM